MRNQIKDKHKLNARKRILRLLTNLILFAVIYYYLISDLDSFHVLINVDSRYLIVGSLFLLLTILSNSSENAVLYRSLGAPMGYFDSFRLTNVSAFFNLIIPQGGSLTKALYLKNKFGIPYEKTAAIFLGLLVIYLVTGATILLVINLIALSIGYDVPLILWIVSIISIVGCLLFLYNPARYIKFLRFGKIGAMIGSFSDSWQQLLNDKSTLARAVIWQFSSFAFSGIWISAVFLSLGVKLNPLLGISLSVLMSFSNIIILLPGNLGIQEAAFGYFASISGMTFDEGVLASLVSRVIILLLTFVLLPFSWHYLVYKQDFKIRSDMLEDG